MDWARILAYVTGTLDQELLARNECLAAGPAQNVVRPWNWFAEPRADRSGIMPMTVWLRRRKLYAFSTFGVLSKERQPRIPPWCSSEAGGGAPWPAKCETQGKTSPSDNYFDKYRLGYGSCTVCA